MVCDFLVELDVKQQKRFLNLVAQGPRPLVAESMGLSDTEDLLSEIQFLHDGIASGKYIEYGDWIRSGVRRVPWFWRR